MSHRAVTANALETCGAAVHGISRNLCGDVFVAAPASPFGYFPVEFRNLKDRKSTRLNSSHSQISYAVFCLKKKNSMMWTSYVPDVVMYRSLIITQLHCLAHVP